MMKFDMRNTINQIRLDNHYIRKVVKYLLSFLLILILINNQNYISANSNSTYTTENINGTNVKYIEINMDNNIKPVILNANNNLVSTDSLTNMAKNAGAFAAINGTYFEAYGGTPVPWGTIIKDGKVLHISNGGSVAGITSSNKLIIDRLSFDFEVYINGQFRAIPWRINHPSTEPDAITIFTPEYGSTVNLVEGAKAAIISNGLVTQIATTNFEIPQDGFAIVYNPSVTYLVDERFKVGDEVYYDVKIKTTFTNTEDWNEVISAVGAGPSLIINGTVTADGVAEGFTEAKINTNKAARSFIGSTSDDKIIIGNMSAATLQEVADIALNKGLINAMCLDGGGSVALYYPKDSVNTNGRNINNGLGFLNTMDISFNAKPTSSNVLVNNEIVDFDAYNINDNNYFKLRDIAMALNDSNNQFDIVWDSTKNAINILTDKQYNPVGGELINTSDIKDKEAHISNSNIYINGENAFLTAYNIDDNNYFKLRDIGDLLNFNVNWNGATNTIIIETN